MKLPHETTEGTDRRRDHVRTRRGQTGTDHRDELFLARRHFLLHRVLHALDQVPLDRRAGRRELGRHRHDERVRRFARDPVRLFRRQNRLGDERRDKVETVGWNDGHECRQERDSILREEREGEHENLGQIFRYSIK